MLGAHKSLKQSGLVQRLFAPVSLIGELLRLVWLIIKHVTGATHVVGLVQIQRTMWSGFQLMSCEFWRNDLVTHCFFSLNVSVGWTSFYNLSIFCDNVWPNELAWNNYFPCSLWYLFWLGIWRNHITPVHLWCPSWLASILWGIVSCILPMNSLMWRISDENLFKFS